MCEVEDDERASEGTWRAVAVGEEKKGVRDREV